MNEFKYDSNFTEASLRNLAQMAKTLPAEEALKIKQNYNFNRSAEYYHGQLVTLSTLSRFIDGSNIDSAMAGFVTSVSALIAEHIVNNNLFLKPHATHQRN